MKTTILAILLFASLSGYGQRNKLEGTIWNTQPVYDLVSKDSLYYSLSFQKNTAIFKVKYKKLARVEIIDTLMYPFVWIKDIGSMKENESCAQMGEIIDDELFTFSHWSHNRHDSIMVIHGIFYRKTENTLNGTVWKNSDGYKLTFTESSMYMQYRTNEKINSSTMKFRYKLNGDDVSLDISNKLKILPGRQTLQFDEPGHRVNIYTKVTK